MNFGQTLLAAFIGGAIGWLAWEIAFYLLQRMMEK